MSISRYRFQIMSRLSRLILLQVTAMIRGTELTGPPEYRSTEWSTDWGCFLETNLLRVVTTSEWITSSDLFKCHVAEWSMIESDVTKRAHFKWLQSQGEVQLTSLLQQWFNTVRCISMNVFLFSVLQGKTDQECCQYTKWWQPAASWRSFCSDTRCCERRPSMRKY